MKTSCDLVQCFCFSVIPKRQIPNAPIKTISQQDESNKTSSHNFRVRVRVRVRVGVRIMARVRVRARVRVIMIEYKCIIF